MADDVISEDERAWHRRIAVEQFNRTWDLIDLPERSADQDAEMLLAATTSRWHWAQIGTAENVAAGDWQVSHVAALSGYGDLAAHFAARNLAIAEQEGWMDWRLASANEAMARACAVRGDLDACDRYIADAERALADEPDPDNAAVVRGQLATIDRGGEAVDNDG